MEMELIETERGKPCLVVDGFRFRRDKSMKTCVYWRCCQVGCRARCATDLLVHSIVKAPSEHSHQQPDIRSLDVDRVRSSVKRKLLEEDASNESALSIVEKEAEKAGTLSHKDVKNLAMSVYRARRKGRRMAQKYNTDVPNEVTEGTTETLGREKALKEQVASLQKQIAELKIALRGKEEENKQLQQLLENLEKELRDGLEAEKASHEQTRGQLETVQGELSEARTKMEGLEVQHKEDLNTLRTQLESEHKESLAAKDAEIADRDQKLSRLKAQMADALKGNSWERQQQLEELTKELTRIQEESDMLRMKIKAMSKNKQSHCTNCDENDAKVKKLLSQLKEKDDTIRELKTLCSKFETQLTTQDKLLEQWAQSKGHKISAPK